MNRRYFARCLGVALAARPAWGAPRGPERRLEAFLRAGTPRTLAVPGGFPRGPLFELRVFAPRPHLTHRAARAWRRRLERLLEESGLPTARPGESAYLIPFASLGERAEAWTRVNAHAEWPEVARDIGGYRFGLYRLSGEPVPR